MRKTILLLFALLLLLVMTGCADTDVRPREDEIRIVIDLSAIEEPVYRADMEYMLHSELMGGLAVSNVRESQLDKQIVFSLDKMCFPEGSDPEGFSFYVVLCGDIKGVGELFSSSEIINHSNECDVFEPQYGSVYFYTVNGNYTDGFELKAK